MSKKIKIGDLEVEVVINPSMPSGTVLICTRSGEELGRIVNADNVQAAERYESDNQSTRNRQPVDTQSTRNRQAVLEAYQKANSLSGDLNKILAEWDNILGWDDVTG